MKINKANVIHAVQGKVESIYKARAAVWSFKFDEAN